MPDLLDAVDALDRLVASTVDIAPPKAVAAAQEVALRIRRRRGYLGSSVLVALAGATGSGKSSILNAIAGEEVAETGSRRPITSEPLAWIPANPEPGLTRLLDDLGISSRRGNDGTLAIIDLPDTDSIESSHREIVDRLLPQIDAVVWVVDPEKYHDRVLHEDFLIPRVGERFIFVLNQSDRIPPTDLKLVVDDFRRGLERGGFVTPTVIAVAADPPDGVPRGIEALVEEIGRLGDAKTVVTGKLIRDCAAAATALAGAAEVSSGGGTGFAEMWELGVEEMAIEIGRALDPGRLNPGDERQVRLEARPGVALEISADVRGLLDIVGGRAGFETRGRLRAIDVETEVESAIATCLSETRPVAIPVPPWQNALLGVRLAGVVAVLLAFAWFYDRHLAFWPGVAVMVGVAMVVIPQRVLKAAAARRVAEVVAGESQRIGLAVAREIDRTVGAEARRILRVRAGAATALVEFELVMAALR